MQSRNELRSLSRKANLPCRNRRRMFSRRGHRSVGLEQEELVVLMGNLLWEKGQRKLWGRL